LSPGPVQVRDGFAIASVSDLLEQAEGGDPAPFERALAGEEINSFDS
jgi:hypothetical protein